MIFSSTSPGDTEIREIRAFPSAMAEHVKVTVPALALDQIHPPTNTIISVRFGDEILTIPYRVYYDKQRLLKAAEIPNEAGKISLCLGTRHYDGFIREQCLRRLLMADEKWMVPFVVQLLGEYVIEVIKPIKEYFDNGIEAKYLEFFKQNPIYFQRLEQRAISYWDAYYRHHYASHKDYPAIKALAALKIAAI